MPMSARLKHDYEALVDEYDQRVAGGESPQEIRASFHSRGIVWGTFQNQRRAINRVRHGTPEEHQDTPEVHPSTPYEVEVLTVHSGTPERSDRDFFTRPDPDVELRPLLPTLRVPTLVLHGEEDQLVPVMAGRYLT